MVIFQNFMISNPNIVKNIKQKLSVNNPSFKLSFSLQDFQQKSSANFKPWFVNSNNFQQLNSLLFFKAYISSQRYIYQYMWNQGFNGGFGFNGGMGGGMGCGFNRWGNPGFNYQNMNGFNFVDYSGGWNPNIHDQMLKNNIDYVYQKYDYNFTGQLEGNEFFYAYSELCLRMGLCPPQNYQDVWNAVLAGDTNMNGRISKMEMFMLFKRIQGINAGMMMMNQGMGMNMGFGGMGFGVNYGGW